ncbi:hypothetical protein BC829DRAFT_420791 [Chytridium lagenaria]|nr:hypothetical protein BC829DRAFT_420791 [Chytridium lagenaria]
MAAVVLPPLLPSTTSWDGSWCQSWMGPSFGGSFLLRSASCPGSGGGSVYHGYWNDILAGTFVWHPEEWLLAGSGWDEEEDAADSNAEDSDLAASEVALEDVDWVSRIKELERENQRLRRKASKGKRWLHLVVIRVPNVLFVGLGFFIDLLVFFLSSSDRERLNLGQDFVPDLLDRALALTGIGPVNGSPGENSSPVGAVRVFPSLASRPLFVRELQLVERAGIKAGVLTSRQRRNWASTIASIQDSVGPMEAEMFIFRRLFGDLGESREDRGVRLRRERIRRKILKDRKLQAASAA